VWRHHGEELCGGDARAAAEVDARLVQGVDAIDTGFTLTRPVVDGVRPLDVTDLLDGFNPVWDAPTSPEDRLARFEQAVAVARDVLARAIAGARARSRAHDLVRTAIAAAEDPRVVVLEQALPWHEPVVTGAPDALYVVYPKSDGSWGAQAVPVALGTFENRRPLPAAWAGLQAAELAALTGVPDAMFCHSARFLAVARSREGVLALVARALAGDAGDR
jgi:uncharacterized UPF0160 family protein